MSFFFFLTNLTRSAGVLCGSWSVLEINPQINP